MTYFSIFVAEILAIAGGYFAHWLPDLMRWNDFNADQGLPRGWRPWSIRATDPKIYLQVPIKDEQHGPISVSYTVAKPLDPTRQLCSICHKDYARLPYGFCKACNEEQLPQE